MEEKHEKYEMSKIVNPEGLARALRQVILDEDQPTMRASNVAMLRAIDAFLHARSRRG